jgi:hypothetical protein
MQYISKQNFNYKNPIDSALVYNVIKYNLGINNAVYNITEMVQKYDTTRYENTTQAYHPKDGAVITMQRNGHGNAPFPIYSLTIHDNGSVIYNGIKNVATSGVKTYQIPKDKAGELINEFINIYYFSLEEKYGDSKKASNLPVVITSININGQTKTVVDDHSSYAPPHLRQLEDKIDQLANSKQWLKHQ